LLVGHADWSVDPRKRWMTLARGTPGSWRVQAPQPVGPVATLLDRLRRQAGGEAVALGVDLPLGLPRGFVERHVREPDFPSFLRALAGRPEFFRVCEQLSEISPRRPFYPARGIAGMTRASHALALGLEAADLSRLCDRATDERPAGAPLFWTLGANQTGKAALAAWRDLVIPALLEPTPPLLWPFDGDLGALPGDGALVLAETYPAEAARHLRVRLAGSKRRQADRAAVAPSLRAAMLRLDAIPEPALAMAVTDGCGADAAGEDRFDCLLGLLCVLNVLAGHRPGGLPVAPQHTPWLRRWEGWVLGQTAVPGPAGVIPAPLGPGVLPP